MIKIYEDGKAYLLIWKNKGWGMCRDGTTTLEPKEAWWDSALAGEALHPDNLLAELDTEAEILPWVKMQGLLND